MSRHFLIITLITMSISGLKASYLDGIIYLKLEDSHTDTLDPSDPLIANAFNLLDTDTFYQPFSGADNPILDRIYRIHFNDITNTTAAIDILENIVYIEYAEKAVEYRVDFIPNDLQAEQWNLIKIDAELAWQITTGSPDITVAVIDNGVRLNHEDLNDNIWINTGESAEPNGLDNDLNGYIDDRFGYDVADNNPDPNPPTGIEDTSGFVHGTHVAGIVSAVTNNNVGIASLGYQTKIMAVKTARDDSDGRSLTHAYDGVFYAIRAGADVINMSFGSQNGSLTASTIINSANNSGIVLVAASGNNSSSEPYYPAAYPNVLAVGATDQADLIAGFSNYGEWIDVMAPGVGILSTKAGSSSSYGNLSGTSMAAPHVAALAALVLAVHPDFSTAEVRNAIIEGADNINLLNPSYVGQLGGGRINAFKTLSNISNVHETTKYQNFKVYPNPFSQTLYIDAMFENNDTPVQINLNDLSGRTVFSKNICLDSSPVAIDLPEELPSGIFILNLVSDEKFFTLKLVKQ